MHFQIQTDMVTLVHLFVRSNRIRSVRAPSPPACHYITLLLLAAGAGCWSLDMWSLGEVSCPYKCEATGIYYYIYSYIDR